MATQLDIANTALFQLGKPPVADLSEQSLRANQAAAKLMQVLRLSLDTVLGRHGWLCALTYATLQPAVIAGDVNWRYSGLFLLPAGCLHVWEVRVPTFDRIWALIDWISFDLIGPPVPEERWEVNTIDTDAGASLVLRCDQTRPLAIAYVRECSYDALAPHLADAVAFDAAARCAWTVTGDRGVASDLAAQAEKKVLMAISTDAMQQGGQPSLSPSIAARIRMITR